MSQQQSQDWVQVHDVQTGKHYFANLKTKQSVWQLPGMEQTVEGSFNDTDDHDLEQDIVPTPFEEDAVDMQMDTKYGQIKTISHKPIIDQEEKYESDPEIPDELVINIQSPTIETIKTPSHKSLPSHLPSTLNDVSMDSSVNLELSTQRALLPPLELHTLDTVWHHIIPCTLKLLCSIIRLKKSMDKTEVDKIIHFIYSKCHLCYLALSTLLYISWILSGAYNYNHILTSAVYWWFIIESTMLLFTANYRMFKEFLCSFTFWYKVISLMIGVISRQLVFDGTDRYLASPWHMFSGISFILSYFIASQIVAALKAYHMPIYLSVIFILLSCVLNIVQIMQIYYSDYEFAVRFIGRNISLRNTAMSAYTNATVFYMKQLFMDTCYKDHMPSTVKLKWVIDQTSHDLWHSGRYNVQKALSHSSMRNLRIFPNRNKESDE